MTKPWLTVTDVKQYVYCPRIVFFTYCIPLRRPITYKMEEGKLQHEHTQELERRRSLRAYGLTKGERAFSIRLHSERLGLSGLLDMAIITPGEVIPVEYKHSTGKLGLNHKYQLVAYGLLCEEKWDKPVRRGFFYLIPSKRAQEVTITPNGRRFVKRMLYEMREMIRKEAMPPPTRHRGRCAECEFRRFCGDV